MLERDVIMQRPVEYKKCRYCGREVKSTYNALLAIWKTEVCKCIEEAFPNECF